MDAEIKAKWVKALRSGKFVQRRHGLFARRGAQKYCCLGVLCAVQDPLFENEIRNEYRANNSTPPIELRGGLTEDDMGLLVEANDAEDWSFEDIAAYVEAML